MGCEPSEIIKEDADVVAGPYEASKKWVGYVKYYDKNIKAFQDLYRELEDQREEMRQRMEFGLMNKEVPVREAVEWMREVEKFLASKDRNWELHEDMARKKAERCCFGFCWSPKYRHALSKKALEISVDLMNLQKFLVTVTPTQNLRPSRLRSTDFCSGLQSRENILEKMLTALRIEKVNKIGIFGMGGTGKRTLARELARRACDAKLFDTTVELKISRYVDIMRIQDQIANCINCPLPRFQSAGLRASILSAKLKDIITGKKSRGSAEAAKRVGDTERKDTGFRMVGTSKNSNKSQTLTEKHLHYVDDNGKGKEDSEDSKNEGHANEVKLSTEKECNSHETKFANHDKKEKPRKLLIVLNDVWDKLDLQSVGIPFELENDTRCTIIIVGIREEACTRMGAAYENCFKVSDYYDEEVIHCFREGVGMIFDVEEFHTIAKELLKYCSNSPLQITLLVDILRNQSPSVWKRALEQLQAPCDPEIPETVSQLRSIIEISLQNICGEKKIFFFLSCLFLNVSEVTICDVLKYGIGMGLFHQVDSLLEAMDLASMWASDLCSLSLFRDPDRKSVNFHIHEFVRMVAKDIASKGKLPFHVGSISRWLSGDSYKTFVAISIISDNSYEYLGGQNLPNLQLLRCIGVCGSKFSVNYFDLMGNLKVLDLSNSEFKSLPQTLEHLKHLETLILEYCSLEDVSQIRKLLKLQVLSFRESYIRRLPEEIGLLVKLKLLDLTNCTQLKEIPANAFVKLVELEGLYMRNSFSRWGARGNMASLNELSSLPLQVLEIEIKGKFIVNIPCLDHLSSYIIKCQVSRPQMNISSSRDLQVGHIRGRDLVKEGWKSLVNKAETLYLEEIQSLKNAAPYLDEYGLNELKRIKISKCTGMKCLVSSQAMYTWTAFERLESLCLEYLPDLDVICYGKYPYDLFSRLQELRLSNMDGLQQEVMPIEHAASIKVLEVKNCRNLKFIFSGGKLERPFLKRLYLANLPLLKGLCADTSSDSDGDQYLFMKKMRFPFLDKLKVKGLQGITELWDTETGKEFYMVFPKLRSISLKYMPQLRQVWSDELCRGIFMFKSVRKLKIYSCESLETVCSTIVARGLQDLELLRIHFSDGVKQLFSAKQEDSDSIISKSPVSFYKLWNLDVGSLPNLTCFHNGHLRFEYPCLTSLPLYNLPLLRTFYEAKTSRKITSQGRGYSEDHDTPLFSNKVQFPCVEELPVKRLAHIGRLWDLKNAQQFLSMFPSLQTFTLAYMRTLQYVWNKEVCKESHNITNLKQLTIESCHSLKSLYQPSTSIYTDDVLNIDFPMLQTLRLKSLKSFTYFLQGNVNLELSALEELELIDLKSIKTFVDPGTFEGQTSGGEIHNEDTDGLSLPLFYQKVSLPKLEKLHLQRLQNVEKVWVVNTSEEFTSIYPTLQYLSIAYLPQIRHVWSNEHNEQSISFWKLVTINIKSCHKLECLFSLKKGTSKQNFQSLHVISFPKLARLELNGLKNLGSLFPGILNMEFPVLKVLIVRKLPTIKILIRRPKFESTVGEVVDSEVKSDDDEESTKGDDVPDNEDSSSDEDGDPEKEESHNHLTSEITEEIEYHEPNTILFNGNVEFPLLEELRIESMLQLEQVYDPEAKDFAAPSYLFPQLKTLHLTGGKGAKLKQLPKKMLRKLSSLSINKMHRLKCLVSSTKVSKDGALFKGVYKLKKLEQLTVEDCNSMGSIVTEAEVQDEEDCELLFPYLKEINLFRMRSLGTVISTNRTTEFPSLESIDIGACPSIRSFSMTSVEARKLNKVLVDGDQIPTDEDLDLNTILQRKYDSINKVAEDVPSGST